MNIKKEELAVLALKCGFMIDSPTYIDADFEPESNRDDAAIMEDCVSFHGHQLMYLTHLRSVVEGENPDWANFGYLDWFVVTATPAQRTKAALKTFGIRK